MDQSGRSYCLLVDIQSICSSERARSEEVSGLRIKEEEVADCSTF